jgi:hypothetical protein
MGDIHDAKHYKKITTHLVVFSKLLEELTRRTFYSVASVRDRKIPTELPLLAGEVSANFCG